MPGVNSSFRLPVLAAIFALGATTVYYWYKKTRKTLSAVRFSKLHDASEFTRSARELVSAEWPSRGEALFDSEEPNAVEPSSFEQSCDTLPCHVIATALVNGERQVVGHAVMRHGNSKSLQRFRKMLQAGVPVGAVKQAMRTSGLDPSALDCLPDTEPHPSPPELEVQASSLVVKPEFRGLGLGKSMCAFLLQVASDIGAVQVVGGCRDELVPYYERLGMGRRAPKVIRKDMPKVRIGNEMYLDVSGDIVHRAEQQLAAFRDRFANWPCCSPQELCTATILVKPGILGIF